MGHTRGKILPEIPKTKVIKEIQSTATGSGTTITMEET